MSFFKKIKEKLMATPELEKVEVPGSCPLLRHSGSAYVCMQNLVSGAMEAEMVKLVCLVEEAYPDCVNYKEWQEAQK